MNKSPRPMYSFSPSDKWVFGNVSSFQEMNRIGGAGKPLRIITNLIAFGMLIAAAWMVWASLSNSALIGLTLFSGTLLVSGGFIIARLSYCGVEIKDDVVIVTNLTKVQRFKIQQVNRVIQQNGLLECLELSNQKRILLWGLVYWTDGLRSQEGVTATEAAVAELNWRIDQAKLDHVTEKFTDRDL